MFKGLARLSQTKFDIFLKFEAKSLQVKLYGENEEPYELRVKVFRAEDFETSQVVELNQETKEVNLSLSYKKKTNIYFKNGKPQDKWMKFVVQVRGQENLSASQKWKPGSFIQKAIGKNSGTDNAWQTIAEQEWEMSKFGIDDNMGKTHPVVIKLDTQKVAVGASKEKVYLVCQEMNLKGTINLSLFDPNKKEVQDFIQEKDKRKSLGTFNILSVLDQTMKEEDLFKQAVEVKKGELKEKLATLVTNKYKESEFAIFKEQFNKNFRFNLHIQQFKVLLPDNVRDCDINCEIQIRPTDPILCLQNKFDQDFRQLITHKRQKQVLPNSDDMTEQEYEEASKEFLKKRIKEENVLKQSFQDGFKKIEEKLKELEKFDKDLLVDCGSYRYETDIYELKCSQIMAILEPKDENGNSTAFTHVLRMFCDPQTKQYLPKEVVIRVKNYPKKPETETAQGPEGDIEPQQDVDDYIVIGQTQRIALEKLVDKKSDSFVFCFEPTQLQKEMNPSLPLLVKIEGVMQLKPSSKQPDFLTGFDNDEDDKFSTLSDEANGLESQQYFSLFAENQDPETEDGDDAKSKIMGWLSDNFPQFAKIQESEIVYKIKQDRFLFIKILRKLAHSRISTRTLYQLISGAKDAKDKASSLNKKEQLEQIEFPPTQKPEILELLEKELDRKESIVQSLNDKIEQKEKELKVIQKEFTKIDRLVSNYSQSNKFTSDLTKSEEMFMIFQ